MLNTPASTSARRASPTSSRPAPECRHRRSALMLCRRWSMLFQPALEFGSTQGTVRVTRRSAPTTSSDPGASSPSRHTSSSRTMTAAVQDGDLLARHFEQQQLRQHTRVILDRSSDARLELPCQRSRPQADAAAQVVLDGDRFRLQRLRSVAGMRRLSLRNIFTCTAMKTAAVILRNTGIGAKMVLLICAFERAACAAFDTDHQQFHLAEALLRASSTGPASVRSA